MIVRRPKGVNRFHSSVIFAPLRSRRVFESFEKKRKDESENNCKAEQISPNRNFDRAARRPQLRPREKMEGQGSQGI